MVTVDEETQAKEFLKRAEIRTMKKDLLSLREGDALKERDKIAHIKTIEEQKAEQESKMQAEAAKTQVKNIEIREVLQKNTSQERIAEKDLKNYATEEERQKIFLFESNRLAFEKQIDDINKTKDPILKLEKNKLLLEKRTQQEKLNTIVEDEKKLENEQKFMIDKEQSSTIPSQRKGLEQSREDLDKKIQDTEKKRWEAEKTVQDTDKKISQIDSSSEGLVTEKNSLQERILGVDKSLRDIYSAVMAREEEKRQGKAQEQLVEKEAVAKVRLQEKEDVQRAQRFPGTSQKQLKNVASLNMVPRPVREKIAVAKPVDRYAKEEELRGQFMQDIENLSENKKEPQAITRQESMQNQTPEPVSESPQPPMPPIPHKK